MSARIAGIGVYLPERRVTADDLAKQGFDVNGAPAARHFASEAETSVRMSVASATEALERSGMHRDAIDLVLFFSGIPDFEVPKDGNLVMRELGISNAAVYTVDTACASFITQMRLAETYITLGQAKNVLLINTMHWAERAIDKKAGYTQIGDGSAAVVLTGEKGMAVSPVVEKTEPHFFDFLELKSPFVSKSQELIRFSHDPKHAKFFLKQALAPAQTLLDTTETSADQINWFVAHQTGTAMLERWTKTLKISADRNMNTYHSTGNMSSVNIPFILHHYIYEEPRIQKGNKILFFAVGAGLHVATMLFDYQ